MFPRSANRLHAWPNLSSRVQTTVVTSLLPAVAVEYKNKNVAIHNKAEWNLRLSFGPNKQLSSHWWSGQTTLTILDSFKTGLWLSNVVATASKTTATLINSNGTLMLKEVAADLDEYFLAGCAKDFSLFFFFYRKFNLVD